MARKHRRRRRALRRGTWKPRSTYASRARDQDKDLLLLMLFDAIEEDDDDLILPLAEAIDNGEDATQWRIRLSQRDALSGGDGKWRKKIRYGSLSNYGGALDPPVSPREFAPARCRHRTAVAGLCYGRRHAVRLLRRPRVY